MMKAVKMITLSVLLVFTLVYLDSVFSLGPVPAGTSTGPSSENEPTDADLYPCFRDLKCGHLGKEAQEKLENCYYILDEGDRETGAQWINAATKGATTGNDIMDVLFQWCKLDEHAKQSSLSDIGGKCIDHLGINCNGGSNETCLTWSKFIDCGYEVGEEYFYKKLCGYTVDALKKIKKW
ncbi:uncharacterized protein LOC129227827 isoform X1 [Uloborus diversus]|uniref:uncharacterized protein LOC129227827 isoform X1 n=1 Tax=Uloborus diversus TaxID=327109 RepID=UPI002409901B|nr:uncharacterized protein LOC129227827 isoform X1 [Uloborus diversus]